MMRSPSPRACRPGFPGAAPVPSTPERREGLRPSPSAGDLRELPGVPLRGSYQTSSPASIPHLILELLKCEPDEPQVQAKIMAYLQQEQANRSKHERLSTFGLMCKMADQTLFSIVEWARSSVFFRELKVRAGRRGARLRFPPRGPGLCRCTGSGCRAHAVLPCKAVFHEGQGSLECCSPWGCKELDTTE